MNKEINGRFIMQNVLLVLIFLTIIAGFIILGIMEWQRVKDNSTKFQIQMQMAEAQASMTNPLKFDDVKKIVTDIRRYMQSMMVRQLHRQPGFISHRNC